MLLYLFLIGLCVIELICIFSVMRQIDNSDDVISWINMSIALNAVIVAGIDTLLVALYALAFGKARQHEDGVKALSQTLLSGLLTGVTDWRARLSVSFEIKQ